jgi:hypothetical protein
MKKDHSLSLFLKNPMGRRVSAACLNLQCAKIATTAARQTHEKINSATFFQNLFGISKIVIIFAA